MTNTLTTQDIDQLQGRELDQAIAEIVCGELRPVYSHEPHIDYRVSGKAWYCLPEYVGGDLCHWEPKAFSESCDLARELENEIERRGLTEKYVEALSEIVSRDQGLIPALVILLSNNRLIAADNKFLEYIWRIRHATPEQCARAALKAVNT